MSVTQSYHPGISKCPSPFWLYQDFPKRPSHNRMTHDFSDVRRTFGKTKIFSQMSVTQSHNAVFSICPSHILRFFFIYRKSDRRSCALSVIPFLYSHSPSLLPDRFFDQKKIALLIFACRTIQLKFSYIHTQLTNFRSKNCMELSIFQK